MSNNGNPSRRKFLAVSSLAAIGVGSASQAQAVDRAKNPIAVFAKHVQSLEFADLGRRLQAIGVDGIEATLRSGGQIDPSQLREQLPRLCEALGRSHQRVLIAASDVDDANPAAEDYIQQLAKHSIPFLRMAHYKYDLSQPLLPQLDAFSRKAQRLAALCESHGLTALYQNHAGRNYVGAAVWDLREVLAEVSPQHLAVAFDIRHASLELSQSYPAGYQAIRSQIGATYVKDFDWIEGQPKNVPLGKGRSKPLFDLIRKDGFVGPLSLHMEYTDHRDAQQVESSWQAITDDVRTLNQWLA